MLIESATSGAAQMTKYGVFQQLPPRRTDDGELEANLVRCGTVYAMSGEDALEKAYNLAVFRTAHGGGQYPIVGPV